MDLLSSIDVIYCQISFIAIQKHAKVTNILKKVLFLLLFMFIIFPANADSGQVMLEFYSQPGCKTCDRIRNIVLPELEDRYEKRYQLTIYDTSEKENFIRLLTVLERLNIKSNHSAHLLMDHSILLAGPEIEEQIFTIMDRRLSDGVNLSKATPQSEPQNWKTLLHKKASEFSTGAVILAGLADGVNPCVFSTLVFFISILSVAKVGRSKMLLTGITYCSACFLTYLLIGCGLFYCLRFLSDFSILSKIINWGMIVILLLFSFISFRDAVCFKRGGGKEDIWLKLPASLSDRIHRLLKRGMSYHVLLPGIFLTGILVTLIESVCTGQVYLPTLVLMAKETGGIKWFLLLLLYNLMFILPLILIFVIVYRGVNTMQLIHWSRHHIVFSKYLLGVLFFLLAILIYYV